MEDGTVLKRPKSTSDRNYFSVFGKFSVPQTCYRADGVNGIMPLDAQANLPERSYSYLLQEWMDLFSLRDSFRQPSRTLQKLLNLKIHASRFEVVNQASSNGYDEFYKSKSAFLKTNYRLKEDAEKLAIGKKKE